MCSNNTEDDYLSPKTLDEGESPRKRMRLDHSGRKGWSLMDKKPDHEVFQEMGVGLLEPDDDVCAVVNIGMHKTLKRKHDCDIENVNPNVNSGSPRKCRSPKKLSPSPGPSTAKSPGDTYKPVQSEVLDSSLEHIAEETPISQSVSAGYMPHGDCRRSVTPQKCPLSPMYEVSHTSSVHSVWMLSDEVMLTILRWLPKRSLATCMLVCKRWYRVASDETLWQRMDLGNKVLTKGALGKILKRKVSILRLANSEIGEWHPTSFTPSRVRYLDLSMSSVGSDTLRVLLERCPLLRKLSLESVNASDACQAIGKCKDLEVLNLTMATGITAEGLAAILEGCPKATLYGELPMFFEISRPSGLGCALICPLVSITSLNISWCQLSEASLHVLCNNLPQRLLRLNLAGARALKDDLITTLVSRCPRLLELDVSDCSLLSALTVTAVTALSRLEHLALSRCYLLPPKTLTKLSCMSSLQYLEVWGMLQASSLAALRSALPAIQINQFMFSAIARPTVGTRRTSIWGLRTRD